MAILALWGLILEESLSLLVKGTHIIIYAALNFQSGKP